MAGYNFFYFEPWTIDCQDCPDRMGVRNYRLIQSSYWTSGVGSVRIYATTVVFVWASTLCLHLVCLLVCGWLGYVCYSIPAGNWFPVVSESRKHQTLAWLAWPLYFHKDSCAFKQESRFLFKPLNYPRINISAWWKWSNFPTYKQSREFISPAFQPTFKLQNSVQCRRHFPRLYELKYFLTFISVLCLLGIASKIKYLESKDEQQ